MWVQIPSGPLAVSRADNQNWMVESTENISRPKLRGSLKTSKLGYSITGNASSFGLG
jgi:hypothetical protein